MSSVSDKPKGSSPPGQPQSPTPFNRINFPLYSVSALSCNHVIVTGGGGAANTGVFNGFAICEIGYENNAYVAYEVQRHATGASSVMNSAIGSFNNGKRIFLAAGKDSECQIFQIKLQPKLQTNEHVTDDGLRRRHAASSNGEVTNLSGQANKPSDSADDKIATDLVFDIQSLISVQTDFSVGDPCQNTICFSPDSRLVVTGGADGMLRVWNFPEMQMRSTINASKKEIADTDISADRKLISCVSKDGKCKIWSLSDGKLNCSLDLPPEDEGKYLYKRCKFGIVEDRRNTQRLFVIINPINYKQHKSYIQHWTGPTFTLTKVVPVGEALSALAVSKCGRYVAIGSMTTGDVDIYVGFSLQRIKHIERAHKTFVTGLGFLPPVQANEESVLADCDAAVVSISVDNQILVHQVEKKNGVSMYLAVFLIIMVLIGTFILCSWVDL